MVKTSVSHKRMVKGYLSMKLHPVFMGYTLVEGIGQSELINEALTKFFKDMNYERLSKYRIAAAQIEINKSSFEKGDNLV